MESNNENILSGIAVFLVICAILFILNSKGFKKQIPKYPVNQALKSAIRPNYCVSVVAGGLNSGNGTTMWDCNGVPLDHQIWNLDEYNRIINKNSGKCLNATNTTDGSQLNQFDCHRGENQQWSVNEKGQLVIKQSGKCLTVADSGVVNGTAVIIEECADGLNQIWA